MNVEKFNKEASELMNSYEGAIGFVTEEVIETNMQVMRQSSDMVIQCVKEAFDICLKQNICAINNETFGNFLLDLSKIYLNCFAVKPHMTLEEAINITDKAMEEISVEDMKKSLALIDTKKKNLSIDEVLSAYDSVSEKNIKDAYKTLSIKTFLGE